MCVFQFQTVSYADKTSCEEGEVRLRDGFDDSNGRVEYCRDRIWGSVCSKRWDDNDARVLCRQLGYNPDGTVFPNKNVAFCFVHIHFQCRSHFQCHSL